MRITSAATPAPFRERLGAPADITAPRLSDETTVVEGPASATLGLSAILLVLGAVCYNTILAFLSARGLPVGMPMVILSEMAVLGTAALILLRSGFRPSDTAPLLLFAFFLVNAVVVSLVSEALFVDMARNVAIIAIFLMIGMRVSGLTVQRTFAIVAALVFAILLFEILSVRSYAALLEPGRYFEQTRGFGVFELDEIGLFRNALGFEDRFSILKIVDHRTSSLFLEQVSLANFTSVLAVFLVAMWDRLSWKLRIAYPLLIALIVVTNNSRTALAIALLAPVVYYVAPKVPRYTSLLLMPAILLTAWLVTIIVPPSIEDNLAGRVGLTMRSLGQIDLTALLGGKAPLAPEFADSGYAYLIYGSSIVGLCVLWPFVATIAAGASDAQKRCSLMLGVYIFGNLLIGGTAVFSIKVAALLWLVVGFIRSTDAAGERSLIHARSSPLDVRRLT